MKRSDVDAGPSGDLRRIWRQNERKIVEDAEALKTALSRLRFEGRQHYTRNLQRAESALSILRERISGHIQHEEKSLFPFLSSHLPKFESTQLLFLYEHREFTSLLQRITRNLKRMKARFPNDRTGFMAHEAFTDGMHLVGLLMSHLKVESRGLHRSVHRDLRADEKKSLLRILSLNS